MPEPTEASRVTDEMLDVFFNDRRFRPINRKALAEMIEKALVMASSPDTRAMPTLLREVSWFLRDCENENVFGPGPHPRFDGLRRDVDTALASSREPTEAMVEAEPRNAIYVLYRCHENCSFATSSRESARRHAQKHPMGWPWEPEFFKCVEPASALAVNKYDNA